MKSINLVLLCAVVVLTGGAWARAGTLANVPVKLLDAEEVIVRLAKELQAHPDSAQAYYQLGRTHYVVGTMKLAMVGMTGGGPNLGLAIDFCQSGKCSYDPIIGLGVTESTKKLDHDNRGNPWPGGIGGAMKPEIVADHLRAAVTNLRLAVAKDDKTARYHLALACALEEAMAEKVTNIPEAEGLEPGQIDDRSGRAGAPQGGPTKRPPATPETLRKEAVAEYLKAYELAIEAEVGVGAQPHFGLGSLVSYEAGRNYLHLAGPEVDPQWKKQIERNVSRFEELPPELVD